jgi:undecaprenyl-diphosphatase
MMNAVHIFDEVVLSSVQSIGPAWYTPAWLLSSIIASVPWALIVLLLVLIIMNKQRVAIEIVCFATLSALAVYGLKYLFAIPRPICDGLSVICYASEAGFAMPSGHALISLVTLGWLWMRHPRSHSLSMGIPTILILIGLSRIYLGVHYPSQVIVGWLAGAVLLAVFISMDRKYFRKRDHFVRSSAKLR